MAPIRVVINGATGKMGAETVNAVCREDDLALIGAACRRERGPTLPLPEGNEVPLSTNLEELLQQTRPDVLVDFTNAATCMAAASLPAVIPQIWSWVPAASPTTIYNNWTPWPMIRTWAS